MAGQTRHKVLSSEDLDISMHNKHLQKAQDARNKARERLAGLQEGMAEYRKAKKALISAESGYEGALEASLGKIGSGSGRVRLLLPGVTAPESSARAAGAVVVLLQAVEASSATHESGLMHQGDQEEVPLNSGADDDEPEEQGRGKRRRIGNKQYTDYDMHSESDSELH